MNINLDAIYADGIDGMCSVCHRNARLRFGICRPCYERSQQKHLKQERIAKFIISIMAIIVTLWPIVMIAAAIAIGLLMFKWIIGW